MTPPSGELQRSGKYRFIAEIGRGGMGEVCLAVAQGAAGFKKLVVVKRARTDMVGEPEVLAMFLDEARLAARLNHPNVVQTYEAGEEAGRYYIAMEYLEGQSLHRTQSFAGPKGFPLAMQIRILVEALSGLHYAHELADFDGTPLGMIHRDATPQNIFLTYDGQIKVVDFGMAKAASSTNKTALGMLKGKVTYMACEQARLEPLDRRTDIFAIGIILWEALAGRRMWQGLSDGAIIRRLAANDLPSLPGDALHGDRELARICRRALQPAAKKRYATAAEMQAELERWLKRHADEVTAREVGKFVATLFGQERAAFKAMLERELSAAAAGPSSMDPERPLPRLEVPSIEIHVDSDLSLSEFSPDSKPAGMRRYWPLAVGGAMVIASGAAVWFTRTPTLGPAESALSTGTQAHPDPGPQGGAPPPPPVSTSMASASAPAPSDAPPTAASAAAPVGSVALTIGVQPVTARIFIDGEPVSNGYYKGKLAKDGRDHRIRVEAPGYIPVEQPIAATGAVIVNLTLERESK